MHKGKRRTDTICKHVAKAAKRGDLQRDIFLASNPSVEERLRNALDVLFNSALLDNWTIYGRVYNQNFAKARFFRHTQEESGAVYGRRDTLCDYDMCNTWVVGCLRKSLLAPTYYICIIHCALLRERRKEFLARGTHLCVLRSFWYQHQ